MAYITSLDAYELHTWDEKILNVIIDVRWGFTLYI